jgi:MFS family permease
LAIFRSLANRKFALMWTGQSISRVGDSLYRIALAWWVLEKTGSALAMGGVLLCSTLPMALLLLIGGALVDRHSRPRIMLFSDLARGLLVIGIAALGKFGVLQIWHIYLASILFGVVDALFQPAYIAAIPEITPPEALPSANALTSLSGEMSAVIGPSLGAVIVGLGGTNLAFFFNGLSFLISAAFLWPLSRQAVLPILQPAQNSGVLSGIGEGFHLVMQTPFLWITILVASFLNILMAGSFSVALPFLVKLQLHLSVEGLGLIQSVFALGSVAAAIWLGRFKRLSKRGITAYGVWAIGGLAMVCFGFPVGLTILLGAALILGASISIVGLIWTNILQEVVPLDMLGRVSSIDYLGSLALLPLGFVLVGWVVEKVGPAAMFGAGGLIVAMVALLGLSHPKIRAMD